MGHHDRRPHQSVGEPLNGLALPALASFEPAYADEPRCCCAAPLRKSSVGGRSVHFRLSTRPIDQPRRTIDPDLAEAIVGGAS